MIQEKLYVECTDCGDMEPAQRSRKVCPFEGKECEGEILMVSRIECDVCDFADDYYEIDICPICGDES